MKKVAILTIVSLLLSCKEEFELVPQGPDSKPNSSDSAEIQVTVWSEKCIYQSTTLIIRAVPQYAGVERIYSDNLHCQFGGVDGAIVSGESVFLSMKPNYNDTTLNLKITVKIGGHPTEYNVNQSELPLKLR